MHRLTIKKAGLFGISLLEIYLIFFLLDTRAFAENKGPLSIGTNPQGTVAYAVGGAVAIVGTNDAGLPMRVVPQGGPPVTIPMVNKGRLDFSVANGFVASTAHQGIIQFEGRPQENVCLLCYLFPLHLGFIVKESSDIHTIADLKGKIVPSKYTKQKNLVTLVESLLAASGLGWSDVKTIPVSNGTIGVDDFISGKADCAYFSLASGKVLQANAAVGGIRVLPIPDIPRIERIIRDHAPGSFVSELKPGSNLPGITRDTRVMSQPFFITVSKDLPDEVAYTIVKAIHASKKKLVAMYKAFNSFDPDAMHMDIDVPYHRGALKFYKESGLIH